MGSNPWSLRFQIDTTPQPASLSTKRKPADF